MNVELAILKVKLKSIFLKNKTIKGAVLTVGFAALAYLGIDIPKAEFIKIGTEVVLTIGLVHKAFKNIFAT